MELRPVWLRIAGESSKAYAFFELYREMGPSRTLVGLAKEGAGSAQNYAQMCKRWKWKERVQAFDDEQSRIRTAIFHARRLKAIDEQAQLGEAMRNKAAAGLEMLSPDALAAHEIAKLAETGVKIERQAYGDAPDSSDSSPARLALPFTPVWAAAQVQLNDPNSISKPADPTERPLTADTRLKMEAANA